MCNLVCFTQDPYSAANGGTARLFAVVTASGAGTPAMNELTARVLRRLSEISSGRWPSLNPNHYYKLWVRFRMQRLVIGLPERIKLTQALN